MISAQQVFSESSLNRKALILAEADEAEVNKGGIDAASELARVINTFSTDYFNLMIDADRIQQSGSILDPNNFQTAIDNEIARFMPSALVGLRQSLPTEQELIKSSKNLYEMSGAVKLAFGNKATRNLSTTMGLLWERIANLSPYAINPESEFEIKIGGIDLISKNKNTNVIEYQQLKTQHNTLTGSQKPRSVRELLIHDHPVFCACFSNRSSWTFNHPDIPRVSGEDFWNRIGISYDIILTNAKKTILALEAEYVTLL